MIIIASVAIALSTVAVSESLETGPYVIQDKENAGNNVLSSNALYQMANEFVALKNRLDRQELEFADLREKLSDSEEKVKEQDYLINGFKSEVTELKSKIQSQDMVIQELVAKTDKIVADQKGTDAFQKDDMSFVNNTVVWAKDVSSETNKIYGKQYDNAPLKTRKRQLNETNGYVAFTAYLDHDLNHLTTGHVVKCNQVLTNMGNHYNKNTGVFTVPTTGVYLLTFFINGKGTNHITFVKAVVDNREIVAAVSAGASWDVTGGNSAIVQLNAGQAVWLEIFGTTQGSLLSNGNYRYVTFSGVLLF